MQDLIATHKIHFQFFSRLKLLDLHASSFKKQGPSHVKAIKHPFIVLCFLQWY